VEEPKSGAAEGLAAGRFQTRCSHQSMPISGSLGIAVKAPNIWWSIQSLGKTTDLTDQKRIFTD